MTVDQMRDQLHEVFGELRELRALARFHGAGYTGPVIELPARVGAFGRVIAPARTVQPAGPTVAGLIEIRWDAIRWLQREIRDQLGVPHPTTN